MLKGKNPADQEFYVLAKLFFRSEWEIKTFPDKQKPMELVVGNAQGGPTESYKGYRPDLKIIQRNDNLNKDICCVVLCLVIQSCLTPCYPMDYSPPVSSVHVDSPGKNTEVGCHALLQRIVPTQGLNPGLPHCRQILYTLSQQGSPIIL